MLSPYTTLFWHYFSPYDGTLGLRYTLVCLEKTFNHRLASNGKIKVITSRLKFNEKLESLVKLKRGGKWESFLFYFSLINVG